MSRVRYFLHPENSKNSSNNGSDGGNRNSDNKNNTPSGGKIQTAGAYGQKTTTTTIGNYGGGSSSTTLSLAESENQVRRILRSTVPNNTCFIVALSIFDF